VASVLIFTSPVWASLLALAFLGEPLRPAHAAALACCLTGVALTAFQPPSLEASLASASASARAATDSQPLLAPLAPPPLVPCAVAVVGAVLNASAFVTIRTVGEREPPAVVVQVC
jgi:drug/metabolite transporter (DMT)-like permease